MNDKDALIAHQLLEEALKLPVTEQITYIKKQTLDKPDLRNHVLNMLAAAHDDTVVSIAPVYDFTNPEQIGPYTILEEIGEGGGGTVYKAQQDEPVKRVVALKVVPGAFGSRLMRFNFETQALSQLEHPNIARFYNAGIDSDYMWFAMEFIPKAKPINLYCEDKPLSIKIDCLIQLLIAIKAAHQSAVIHRDIKPSNVLVTEEGKVKVIDFGIARTTDPTATHLTHSNMMLGTPPFMAPEAFIDGSILDVRCDVYGVGVIMYQMLSGEIPYKGSLATLIKVVTDFDSPPPMIDIYKDDDLGIICNKALAKDRTLRYGGAAEFLSDLNAYTRQEPIKARPPNLRYVLWLFCKRNKQFMLASIFASFVVVVASVISINRFFAAQASEARAVAVSDFLTDTLAQASPYHSGADIRLSDVLTSAASRMDQLPDAEAATIHQTLATAFLEMGDIEGSAKHQKQAARLAAITQGKGSTAYATSQITLARIHQVKGRVAAAIAILETIVNQEKGEVKKKASWHLSIIVADMGDYDRAFSLLNPYPDDATMLMAKGYLHLRTNELDESEVIFRRLLDMDVDFSKSEIYLQLGGLYRKREYYSQSKEYFELALQIKKRTLGNDHFQTAYIYHALGNVFWLNNEYEESLFHIKKALEIFKRDLGDDGPMTLSAELSLSAILDIVGEEDKALLLAKKNVGSYRRVYGVDYPLTLRAEGNHAYLLMRNKRLDDALLVIQNARMIGEAKHPNSPLTYQHMTLHGIILLAKGERQEAKRLFDRAHAYFEENLKPDHPFYVQALLYSRFFECEGLEELDVSSLPPFFEEQRLKFIAECQ